MRTMCSSEPLQEVREPLDGKARAVCRGQKEKQSRDAKGALRRLEHIFFYTMKAKNVYGQASTGSHNCRRNQINPAYRYEDQAAYGYGHLSLDVPLPCQDIIRS